MKRNEVEKKYTWDLSCFYKSDKDWYKDFENLKKYLGKLGKYKGKLDNPDTLLKFLEEDKNCSRLIERLAMYASNSLNIDLSSQVYNEMMGQLNTVASKLSEETSFVEPELLGLKESYFKILLSDPRFKNHKFWLSDLNRDRAHVLSEKEEKILSGISNFASDSRDVFDSLVDVDFKFKDVVDSKGKTHTLTHASYHQLLEDKDRTLRKNAYTEYYTQYQKYNNTLFTNFYTNLKVDNFESIVHKFKSCFEESLYADNVDPKLYNKLKSEVNKHLDLAERYYNLKANALKLKDLSHYDLNVSICEDFEKKYTFEQAFDIVVNALKPLGDDYINEMKKCITERWIDVYPTENKITGGYNTGCYDGHQLVLLNFVGNLDDVSTLGHELGHAMHGVMSKRAQPYETYDYSIFLAEIASTFNEILVTKYLLSKANNNQEKLYYLDRYATLFLGTIYRQVQYSEFEEFAHNLVNNNLPISKELLNDQYAKLNAKYYKGVAKDDLKQYHWSIVPHFYRSFYVYKYATGLISAVALSTMVLNGSDTERNKYFGILEAGGSDYPTNILKNAGVDLTTSKPYELAFGEFEKVLSEMEQIINKK